MINTIQTILNTNSSFLQAVLGVTIILVALAYVLRHPFIKEGSSGTKNIVAVAIGVMLTILITHLLPEIYSDEESVRTNSFIFLFSLICFYILGWTTHDHEHDDEHENHTHTHRLENMSAHNHNHHEKNSDENSMPVMYIGQSVHSIADGVVIASSFALNVYLGIVTVIAISIHHIPMMSGVVLRHNNKSNFRKLFAMTIFSSAFMFVGLALFSYVNLHDVSSALIAVAAASFLYVGAYDLTSYLREYDDKKIFKRVMFIFLGVMIGIASQSLGGERVIEEAMKNKTENQMNATNTTPYISGFEDGTIDEVEGKEIILTSTRYLSTELEYPKYNPAVKSWILESYNIFASDSNRVMDEYDARPYEYQAKYKVATTTDYVSYVYNIYNFTGGAHGVTDQLAYITNTKTMQRVKSLEDIYKKEIYKYLESYSRKDLVKQFSSNGADQMLDNKWLYEGTAATSTNYTNFWFETVSASGSNIVSREVLVVHFGQYQVAAYAAGMFDVRVPLTELEKFRK